MLEEIIHNCPELDAINSSSLNTIRVYTANYKGKSEILAMMLRCGVGSAEIDNWGAGGVAYPVNLMYGIIDGKGVDKKGNHHVVHPGTNKTMIGMMIPRFEQLCRYALNIASVNSNVKYAGLDIAITPESFELIELNFPGGHDLLQPFGEGLYDKIRPLFQS